GRDDTGMVGAIASGPRQLRDRADRLPRTVRVQRPWRAEGLYAAVRAGESKNIPYTVEVRLDAGLHNGKLGGWLVLASGVMLFGALFSSYILLRVGAQE